MSQATLVSHSHIPIEGIGKAIATSSTYGVDPQPLNTEVQVLVETPRGNTAAVSLSAAFVVDLLVRGSTKEEQETSYHAFMSHVLQAVWARDTPFHANVAGDENMCAAIQECSCNSHNQKIVLIHNGHFVDKSKFSSSQLAEEILNHLLFQNDNKNNVIVSKPPIYVQWKCLGRGGMDRQNRVGSKFGGGGVSSAQNAERERKDRLKQLALESIDLAKDPYLMRNHLGTYECKLCLTLHTNEANYLSHTQGKKHQQGLARRAHMEKLKQEKEQQQQLHQQGGMPQHSQVYQPKAKKIRIGRPAYQVFKSRDAETNQRCLSFELQYPEIEEDLQPRHRFMSAFEQRVESPPDRRFQYLLFAAEPYETVAFKIPNEPIDKNPERFVSHWDADDKKFTVTLYFLEQQEENGDDAGEGTAAAEGGLTVVAPIS